MKPVSLYIHIPFCRKKCSYCCFYSTKWTPKRESDFLSAIEKEINFYLQKYNRIKIKTLYLGGGNPGSMSLQGLSALLDILHSKFIFTKKTERTIELNPESVQKAYLSILKKYDFNRISLGVQSFSDSSLKLFGRGHSVLQTEKAIELLRNEGFRNINFDLIFGQEELSNYEWALTLKKAISYQPEHISTYSLSIEEGSLFYAQEKKQISQECDLEQYKIARKLLSSSKYNNYEVSAFCKKGFESEHNITYWTFQPYIGLGPSSSSYFDSSLYTNPSCLKKYTKNPKPDIIDNRTALLLNNEDALSFYLIANIRLLDGLLIKEINDRFKISFTCKYEQKLAKLIKHKLIKLTATKMQLTAKGLYLLDTVLLELL
jgi:oxygen-independent coproporphyrinogen III oxidase